MSSELRQRKGSSDEKATSGTATSGRKKSSELVLKYVDALASKLPEKFKPTVQKVGPLLVKFVEFLEFIIPILAEWYRKALDLWEKLKPYHLDVLAPSIIGLIMCFFGGSFLTLIAAMEAYRMCGYETTLQSLKDLRDDFAKVVEENSKDDAKDDDGDGVVDVLQVSPGELATRKVLLFFRSVDPKRVTAAINGLNAGFLAVVATLKLQFAMAVTLGSAIGQILEVPAKRFALPFLESLLPAEYKKWAEPAIEYLVRSISISLAWSLQRVLSAFHSATRGGLMCSRNILEYLSHMKIIHIDHENTYLDEIVGFALAFLGLWFQLGSGFTLFFPLNVLLFPFSIMEWFLVWSVNSK